MATQEITRGLPAIHPGALLREDIMPTLDRPVGDVARMLGVSRQTLHSILTERQPLMALKLGKLCGNGPDLWMRMQARYDLERVARESAPKLMPCQRSRRRNRSKRRPAIACLFFRA